jgi:hypothetical protein
LKGKQVQNPIRYSYNNLKPIWKPWKQRNPRDLDRNR